MKQSAVFETTYRAYLDELTAIDLESRSDVLGAAVQDQGLIIPFFGTPYHVSGSGVIDRSGKRANFAVSVVLCKYVLMCPPALPLAGDWITYREFKDAGPLVTYFANNTNKTIETAFSGNIVGLLAAAERLNGSRVVDAAAVDLSLKFDPLPRVPALVRFNDRDDDFPAQCTVLFRQSAETFLDMECLAIAGTFLAGHLIR